MLRAVVSDDFSEGVPTSRDYCHNDGNIACKYFDPHDLSWPVEGRAVVITTFAKDRVQRLHNGSRDYENTEEHKFYTVDPESVIIKVSSLVEKILA